MNQLDNPIPAIQNAKHDGRLFFTGHALRRMFERYIKVEHVEEALNCSNVELLENYPQTGRPQPECLILGIDGHRRSLHVVVAYPVIEVITTYEPAPPKWNNPRQRGER